MSFFLPEPPPTPKNVFVLATPQNMLEKLHWELRQFRKTISDQREDFAAILDAGYRAFNCAVTAWHCADWAWGYADRHIKSTLADRFSLTLSGRDRTDREHFFDAVCKQSRDLQICRDIANSSKHLKLDKPVERGFWSEVAYSDGAGGIGYSHFALMIEDSERGGQMPLDRIFERAFDYWEQLYGTIGYTEARYIGPRE
jgi:hypothetical protein